METGRYDRSIALFGGSFDPVHIGHLAIASAAAAQFCLDAVVFVPARRSPFKESCAAEPFQRLAMLKLAIAGDERFQVSADELTREEPSYTWETVAAFRRREPGARMFLIAGEDAFAGIAQWRNIEWIVQEATFLVAPRTGATPSPASVPVRAERIEIPCIDVSSTWVRQACARGVTIRYLVPEQVVDYIRREGLYGLRHP